MLSSTLAGGICGGGLFIGVLALLGRGSPGLHLLMAPALFLLGSAVGVGQGLFLALVGRGDGVSRAETLRRCSVAVAVSLLLLPVSWLISSSIVVATALRAEMRLSWLAVSAVGTALGLVVLAWAVLEGWRMVAAARERHGRPS